MIKDPEKRFWLKILIRGADECWEFRGYKDGDGYGQLEVDGIRMRAHRYAYIISKGDIPKGKFVLHKCDNPTCVNPNHLYVGTQSDNVKDIMIRKRGRGSKLSAEKILVIRRAKKYGDSQRKVASMYNVTHGLVGHIWNRDSYKCREGYYI